jgi:hypothetical protein
MQFEVGEDFDLYVAAFRANGTHFICKAAS